MSASDSVKAVKNATINGRGSGRVDSEMLSGSGHNAKIPMPIPIHPKQLCKSDPEHMHDSNCSDAHDTSSVNSFDIILKEENYINAENQSECEDDIMTLCRVENYVDEGERQNYILFICPQCGKDFPNSTRWQKHIDRAHNLNDQNSLSFTQRSNNEFLCNKCQKVITRCTLKTLQLHHFSHQPFKMYMCKLCCHDERSLYLMISHIMWHKQKEEDDDVNEKSNKRATLAMNSKIELETKQLIAYICPVCGKTFETEDLWQAHINFEHNFLEKTAENRFGDHFKCTECSVEIFSQHVTDLQQHLFTHLPFKAFLKCNTCNWTISRINFMIAHILHLHKSTETAKAGDEEKNNDKARNASPSRSLVYEKDDYDDDHDDTDNDADDDDDGGYDDDDNDDDDGDDGSIGELIEVEQNTKLISPPVMNNNNNTSAACPTKTAAKKRYVCKKVFRCKRCTMNFPTAAQRKTHDTTEHGKYFCSKCKEKFALRVDLNRHKCPKPNNTYGCPKCSKEYNYEKCYQNHVRKCNKK